VPVLEDGGGVYAAASLGVSTAMIRAAMAATMATRIRAVISSA